MSFLLLSHGSFSPRGLGNRPNRWPRGRARPVDGGQPEVRRHQAEARRRRGPLVRIRGVLRTLQPGVPRPPSQDEIFR